MNHIAILTGGDSSEAAISLESAKEMANILASDQHLIYKVKITGSDWKVIEYNGTKSNFDIDKNDFSVCINEQKIQFDFVLIMLHGSPGEDGKMQSYFEMLSIPFSTCDSFVSALTFNKFACKTYLKAFGIPMADSLILRSNKDYSADEIIDTLGLPCFVKPNTGGSSFGISKVKTKSELFPAIELALKESPEIIIESFIQGTEVSNGVLKIDNKIQVLPITEIVSENDFFDYEAKYYGKSQEITPARISKELTLQIKKETEKIYRILNCKGIVRVDYIISDDTPYFLEINTVPGMSSESIIPKQLREIGLDIRKIFEKQLYTSVES